MGYNTDFDGQVSVEPPLSAAQVASLQDFAEERHGGATHPYAGFPGLNCKWEPTRDGAAIEWNGVEKFYNAPEWMQYIIDHFLTGHTVNGTIYASGEEAGDVWRLVVKDNVVSTQQARITYDS
jgi:hypothetical protein